MVYTKKIVVIFLFCFFCYPIFSQKVYNPTVASSGITKEENFNVYATFGETISGVKKIKNYVFIEGFYSTFDFYSNVINVNDEITKFSTYPNPSKKKFNIENKSNNNVIINILNLSGTKLRILELESNKVLSINDLQTGAYLISVSDKKGNKIGSLKQIIL